MSSTRDNSGTISKNEIGRLVPSEPGLMANAEATPADFGRRYALEDLARAAEAHAQQFGTATPEPDWAAYRAAYVATCEHAAHQLRMRASK